MTNPEEIGVPDPHPRGEGVTRLWLEGVVKWGIGLWGFSRDARVWG